MSIHGLVNGFSSLSNLHCSPHFLGITQQRHMWEHKCPTHSDQTINTKSTWCSILEIWTRTWVAKVCSKRGDWRNTQCPILYSPDSTFNIVFPVVRTHLTQTISCWELHMREQLCTIPCLDVFKSFYNWKQVSVDPCAGMTGINPLIHVPHLQLTWSVRERKGKCYPYIKQWLFFNLHSHYKLQTLLYNRVSHIIR